MSLSISMVDGGMVQVKPTFPLNLLKLNWCCQLQLGKDKIIPLLPNTPDDELSYQFPEFCRTRMQSDRPRKMIDRFFFRQPTNFKLPDTQGSILLLSGPPSSGKTSLLFQFAFNSAAENNGAAVVILCRRRRLQMNPPFLSQGIDPSSEVFQRIQMKYVDDDDGIKNYFAAFHLHDKMPKLVVIDDFADFFDERKCQVRHNSPRGRDLAMARVLSLCRNAIDHANKRGSCELLLSDTHKGDSSKLLYIYKRWVSHIYTIKESDGSGTYILKTQHHSHTTDKKTESAKYSISLQYLELEGVNEGSEG